MSATEAGKKTSKVADEEFKKAIEALSAYEEKYHTNKIVAKKMAEAEQKDKSFLADMSQLKAKFRSPLVKEPTKTVEFHILKSLPDRRPTIVKQELSKTSNLQEILWNFSHFKGEKRLTLKQNPHFYQVLPTLAEQYEGKFRRDPVETFDHEKINVLTDNLGPMGRVFIETAKESRAFGNVWAPRKAIIFKDVGGKLEGESIVGEAIQDIPNLWWFEEPPLSPTSRSPDRSSPSSSTTTTPTTPTLLKGDWREPIRRMLLSQDVNIRISAKPPTQPPTNSNPSHPATSLSGSSNTVGSLSPTVQPRPPITIRISGAPTRSLPPSSNNAAQSKFLPQQPRTAEVSKRSLAPRPPEPNSILLTHSTCTPTPRSNVPLPISPPLQSHTVVLPLTRQAAPVPTTHISFDEVVVVGHVPGAFPDCPENGSYAYAGSEYSSRILKGISLSAAFSNDHLAPPFGHSTSGCYAHNILHHSYHDSWQGVVQPPTIFNDASMHQHQSSVLEVFLNIPAFAWRPDGANSPGLQAADGT
ncbi:hypothetical protein BJV77DRAFT_1066358 [Russula vinacea]|nr:hypothetical protein BJV77DRAFT_1066358 [Russula vinacea]